MLRAGPAQVLVSAQVTGRGLTGGTGMGREHWGGGCPAADPHPLVWLSPCCASLGEMRAATRSAVTCSPGEESMKATSGTC